MNLDLFLPYVDKIESIYSTFITFTKSNPVIGGMAGLWLMGIVTYAFKYIPLRIMYYIRRYSIVSVTVSNRNKSFLQVINWLEDNNKLKKPRTIRMMNGRWGDCSTQITAGLGHHWFWLGLRPYIFYRYKEESVGSDFIKEEIRIETIGITPKSLMAFLKKTIPEKKEEKQCISTWTTDGWRELQELDGRPIDSVILRRGQKDRILNFIKEFEDSRDWYVTKGIPYRTGIMLSGPAGTGKTSLIRSIGSHLGKDLCIINCNSISDSAFQRALCQASSDSIILLEDFDSVGATKCRVKAADKDDPLVGILGLSTSGLLNAIDGIFTSNGRIIIATTNHMDKLDAAVVRPGRFDLKEELGYTTQDMAVRFFNKFFPDHPTDDVTIGSEISPAQVENCFLINKDNPEEAKKALRLLTPSTKKKTSIIPEFVNDTEEISENDLEEFVEDVRAVIRR